MEIWLQPFGDINYNTLETLKNGVHNTFGCPVLIKTALPISQEAYNPGRNQYLADRFLDDLEPYCAGNNRILGVTDVDLFTHKGNFVFGLSDNTSGTAVISLHLLPQEYYGLPVDTQLFHERALKEAVHELGHTFGIEHCENGYCVMYFSGSLLDTDVKQNYFCHRCQPKLLF